MTFKRPTILIIKHGALGDFFFALGAMKKIAEHHADQEKILLTTAPFVGLAEKTGYFDSVAIDERASLLALQKFRQLQKWSKARRFERIYDLQNVLRTRTYMWTIFSPSNWNGESRWASLGYRPDPAEGMIHQIERKRRQLARAGLLDAPDPDLSFLKGDLSGFGLPEKYFLLVPGSSPLGGFKRWPAIHYAWIAQKLVACGITPVIIGTKIDEQEAQVIQDACPQAISLCSRTSIDQLAPLGREAIGVLGNDTGPFHILWLAGCPSVGLFSGRSDPQNCGPVGLQATLIQKEPLDTLSPQDVWEVLRTKHGFSPIG